MHGLYNKVRIARVCAENGGQVKIRKTNFRDLDSHIRRNIDRSIISTAVRRNRQIVRTNKIEILQHTSMHKV